MTADPVGFVGLVGPFQPDADHPVQATADDRGRRELCPLENSEPEQTHAHRPPEGILPRNPRDPRTACPEDVLGPSGASRGPTVTRVHLTPAGSRNRRDGLLGWLSFALDGSVLVDGIALRLAADGSPALRWPARRDGNGLLRYTVRPLSEDARLAIERQVLAALEPGLSRRTS